jgi:type IV secretion system protein VirD4
MLYEMNESHFFEATMRWKPNEAHPADLIAHFVNMRSPDQDMLERLEEISVVRIEQLEEMEGRMNALL